MSRTNRKRNVLLLAILIILVCCIGYAFCISRGYLLLNNPSRSQYPIVGTDLSHYQGTVKWDVLSKEDIAFAYIKATEGSSYVDEKFSDNWKQAGKTDLRVGAYHFFSFDSPGETQAMNFITSVGIRDGMLPPAIDVEYYADKKINPPTPEHVREQLQAMLYQIETYYQTTPVIYSTEEVWERYLKGHFDDYPVWIRNVITKPRIQEPWTFWQYTNRARLKGYSGEEEFIDLNVYHGTVEQWEQWLAEYAVSVPEKPETWQP